MFWTRLEESGKLMQGKHFEVDWAEELGVDRRQIWREHPGHPEQLKNKKLMMQQSELYWKSRHLESLWADCDKE